MNARCSSTCECQYPTTYNGTACVNGIYYCSPGTVFVLFCRAFLYKNLSLEITDQCPIAAFLWCSSANHVKIPRSVWHLAFAPMGDASARPTPSPSTVSADQIKRWDRCVIFVFQGYCKVVFVQMFGCDLNQVLIGNQCYPLSQVTWMSLPRGFPTDSKATLFLDRFSMFV